MGILASEAIYLKYMEGVESMSRLVLFVVLGFLKRYPKSGQYEHLSPRILASYTEIC